MNELFVYGIFLNPDTGERFGFKYHGYQTVDGYATRSRYGSGSSIVEAVEVPGLTLTGLLVTVPEKMWKDLDRLEGGYKRIVVDIGYGRTAYMYASRDCEGEDHSTLRR